MKHWLIVIFALALIETRSQPYTVSSIFAHNDYAQPNPFYNAYALQIGFIEADVFLQDDQLFVAHQRNEIAQEKTLERLYLKALQEAITKNKGYPFPDSTRELKLMIDLKMDGISTLKKLVEQLNAFPELITARRFQVFISGNVPSPDRWKEFPTFIHFDGRPGIQYTPDQLERVTLISTSFIQFSKWNAQNDLPEKDKVKLDSLINSVHAMGKKIRFWAAPDSQRGWKKLMELKADIIGTDHIADVVQFIRQR